MRTKDSELQIINSDDIKNLEQILGLIDEQENGLLNDFDRNIDTILGDSSKAVFEELKKLPNYDVGQYTRISINNVEYHIPKNFLLSFHKSYIKDKDLRATYVEKLTNWFSNKTTQIKSALSDKSSYESLERVLPPAFALASLALTSFHRKPNMILRDTQKMAGIVMSRGDIAEIGSGEGKTLSAVLPVYLHSLNENGTHVVLANDYLARRDFEEVFPIFNGLGIRSGYLPEFYDSLVELEDKEIGKLEENEYLKRLTDAKQKSYSADVTYGSINTFAYDYLRDNNKYSKGDVTTRGNKVDYALIDDADLSLVDSAVSPYKIANNSLIYVPNMSLKELCNEMVALYQEVLSKANEYGINPEHLSYDEARFITSLFGKNELLASIDKYQDAAQKFLTTRKVLVVEDKKYGFKTGKELFDAILDEDKYDADLIRKTNDIIYCRELGKYIVSDKSYDDYIKYCYFDFMIDSQAIRYQEQIKSDKNYIVGTDYDILPDGRISLSLEGANKVLNDSNYPEFIDDYNKFLRNIPSSSSILLHTFNQAVAANILMKKEEDYIVENGKIRFLKNVNSIFSNGLKQAIEFKENIPLENRTNDMIAPYIITQKEYFNKYNMFSGMTNTSDENIFKNLFNKNTIQIPSNSIYSYYGNRKKSEKEPIDLLKEKIKFTLNNDDKLNLIVNSIKTSRDLPTKQPVLLMVANIDEVELLKKKLDENAITYSLLSPDIVKDEQALILAKAGCPGVVTIAYNYDSLGSIKIGGDRDTVIDVAYERHIKLLEKKQGYLIDYNPSERSMLRNKVEDALLKSNKVRLWSKEQESENKEKLEGVGLKVISDGIFNLKRIDNQLEDMASVLESYASLNDLKSMGVNLSNGSISVDDVFNKSDKKPDGSISIEDNVYNSILSGIEHIQCSNEQELFEKVRSSQENGYASSNLIEKYREKRRKIIDKSTDLSLMYDEMLEANVDGIISSYVLRREISNEDLNLPVNDSSLRIDIKAVELEAKSALGITFDAKQVENSKMTLLEFRNAILNTAKERHKQFLDNDGRALLLQCDYIISSIPDMLENSYTVKKLVRMPNNNQLQEIHIKAQEKLYLDACKLGCMNSIGTPLSRSEFKELEMKKAQLYEKLPVGLSLSAKNSILKTSSFGKKNASLVEKFKIIKEKLQKKQQSKALEAAQKKEDNSNKPVVDVTENQNFYSNVKVRPLKFMDAMVDGKNVSRVVLVKDYNKLGNVKNAVL